MTFMKIFKSRKIKTELKSYHLYFFLEIEINSITIEINYSCNNRAEL